MVLRKRGAAAQAVTVGFCIFFKPEVSECSQLNTIRHVVIWLDPWSRERDLLAAVVDR